MQWLIDLIKEWVQAQGYLTTSYVDRGDPVNADFRLVHFIKDDAWHTLDLRDLLPIGATAVLFHISLQNSLGGKYITFRTSGNINERNIWSFAQPIANFSYNDQPIIYVTDDRTIEYKMSTAGWLSLALTVRGWWL